MGEKDMELQKTTEMVGNLTLEVKPFEAEEGGEPKTWKPTKKMTYVALVIFTTVGVLDKLLYDELFKQKFFPGIIPVIPVIFFFDAVGRFFITLFLVNWETIKRELSWNVIGWVSFCRIGLQIGFLIGAMSFAYIGAGTASMIFQIQLLLTGFFRYFVFGDTLSQHQFIYALVVVIGAVAFKIDVFDKKDGKSGLSDDNQLIMIGLIMASISAVIVSLFFTLTEKLLKDVLSPFQGWDKQFLIAMIDIPVMIMITYLNISFDYFISKTYSSTDRFINPFLGISGIALFIAANCIAFGFLLYFLFEWTDAIIVNLLFVISMAFTWPLEIAIGYEPFYISRSLILLFTFITCCGYQAESFRLEKERESCKDLQNNIDSKSMTLDDEAY